MYVLNRIDCRRTTIALAVNDMLFNLGFREQTGFQNIKIRLYGCKLKYASPVHHAVAAIILAANLLFGLLALVSACLLDGLHVAAGKWPDIYKDFWLLWQFINWSGTVSISLTATALEAFAVVTVITMWYSCKRLGLFCFTFVSFPPRSEFDVCIRFAC